MAGIGVRLNRIYSKRTITTNLIGYGYSLVITIAPMILIVAAVILMRSLLDFTEVGYAERELYSCTVPYIFIFALLVTSPFNAVLSRYMSDVIYNEEFSSILPCYYLGLIMNVVLAFLLGVPFCIHEYFVGEVSLFFVLLGYFGFLALVITLYSMLFLSICKDYKKISLFFLIGMALTVLLSLVLVRLLGMKVIDGMLLSLDIGFLVIGALEYALIRSYFRENNGDYMGVLRYFAKYWQLIVTNFLYTLGLCIHNFVFWSTDMHIVVAKSFVVMTTYDMASYLGMITSITASVIFISRVEMHFHDRYKLYSESVIGGRGMDIETAKQRMFRQLAEELMNLVRIQFIISVVLFLVFVSVFPQFGFNGMVMKIYPCLAAGYFILFMMYSAILFLYYLNDLYGALLTSVVFCLVTFLGSLFSSHLSVIWFGLGLVIGSLAGWCVAYYRLRVMERTLDIHIFCNGNIMKRGHGKRPSNKVYEHTPGTDVEEEKRKKEKDEKGGKMWQNGVVGKRVKERVVS